MTNKTSVITKEEHSVVLTFKVAIVSFNHLSGQWQEE